MLVDDRHLHVARLVGDDAKARHFAGRSSRGVDRHQGQLRLGRLVKSLVVLDRSAIGSDQCDSLGAVVRRTAAERDDEITIVVAQLLQPIGHVLGRRVGLHSMKNQGIHAVAGKKVAHVADQSETNQGKVGHDQRFPEAIGLDGLGCITKTARAHQVHGRNEKGGGGHGLAPSVGLLMIK